MRKELEFALKPAAPEPAHDGDGFDATDVTMATFSAGHQAQPSEEVTLGTRPLAPSELPAALAALHNAAPPSPSSDLRPPTSPPPEPRAVPDIADAAPSRHSRPDVTSTLFPVTFLSHKRLIIGGSVAAALLALGLGGFYLFSGKKSPPSALRPPTSDLRSPASPTNALTNSRTPALPASPASPASPTPALTNSRTNELTNSRTPALPASPASPTNALTNSRTNELLSVLLGLPARIAEAPASADLQTLATAFLKLEATPGVKLAPAQVTAVEQAFAARYLAFAKPLAEQASEAYAAGKTADGATAQKSLAEFVAPIPVRFGKEALARLEKEVDAARQTAEAAAAKAADAAEAAAATAAARAKELEAAAAQADAVLASAKKGMLAACAENLKTLAVFTPALLSDPGVNAKWEAARAACSALLEQALALKDPLEQRAQRIKLSEDTLGAPAAEQVIPAERLAELRKSLEQQKAVGILRLVNQGEIPVTVTARELPGKTPLAGGEVKEWALPVSGETLTLSVSVDGGNRFRSRIETLKLPRSGGLERAIGALEATAPAPAQPLTPPTPPTTPALPNSQTNELPHSLTNELTNSRTNELTNSRTPALLSAAAFDVSISPKTAEILIDGKPASAGRVEVTPNENHKVTASCPGYKPVQQYYKARPGETRKIDILLEKEPKKSIFGF